MTNKKIPYLDFVHNSYCIIMQSEFDEFKRLYWLSQYGNIKAYKKDNRMFRPRDTGSQQRFIAKGKFLGLIFSDSIYILSEF